jgi:hypothetical protein
MTRVHLANNICTPFTNFSREGIPTSSAFTDKKVAIFCKELMLFS